MNQSRINILKSFAATLVLCIMLFSSSMVLAASDTIDIVPDETVDGSVELNPAYITGTIDIGGQSISRICLYADSQDYSAKTYPNSEGQYTMAVNVPKDGELLYEVYGLVDMDSYKTFLRFKTKTTTVSDGNTSVVNFIINPGYIEGKVLSNECGISKGTVYAQLDNGSEYTWAETQLGSDGTFRLPVQPNSGIKLYGKVELASGAAYDLTAKYMDVAPGSLNQTSWEIDCQSGELGHIRQDVDYKMDIDYHYTDLFPNNSWTSFKYARHDGKNLFENLAPGSWKLVTRSYWNNGYNCITRYTHDVDVQAGRTTDTSIDETPGFLHGKITLRGTKNNEDLSQSYLYFASQNFNASNDYYYSRSMLEADTGNFQMVLPPSVWRASASTYSFSDKNLEGEYLYSILYMYDNEVREKEVQVSKGQVITGYDIVYETGSATVKYTRSDGGGFSSPYIYANAFNYDEARKLKNNIHVYSRGGKTDDTVTFVGFPGTFEVEAWAMVDGSHTMFGKPVIEIIPGVEKVVDIGGPTLEVIDPEPGLMVSENTVLVNGTATSEIAINFIMVNDQMAEMVSTDNPDNPNEVSFSIEIDLDEGENIIETIAVDISGNSSSDKRKVTYEIPELEAVMDTQGPVLNIIEPEADVVTSNNTVIVSGTATDDSTIIDISVNGLEAVIESTHNPDDPNEVSFSIEIDLEKEGNTIETIATDILGNSSFDSRGITYKIVKPRIIKAILDIKPGSCNNPFNVKSRGVLPVVILGSKKFNISEINPWSIRIKIVKPKRTKSIKPKKWSRKDTASILKTCNKNNRKDGYKDLVLKFNSRQITKALGKVSHGQRFTLRLMGRLKDGSKFKATDTIKIIKKRKKRKKIR